MAVPSPSPSPDDAAAAKAALRRDVRARRQAFVAGLADYEREELEEALAVRVLPLLPPFGTLASYAAIGDEIYPGAVEALFSGMVAFPHFDSRDAPMTFRAAGVSLVKGPYGVPQPVDHAPELEPDAVLVPLIAATPAGLRLGQGGGHYDRWLAAQREAGLCPPTIGVAWDCQIVDSLPAEPWDEMLDYIATPTALYGPHGRTA